MLVKLSIYSHKLLFVNYLEPVFMKYSVCEHTLIRNTRLQLAIVKLNSNEEGYFLSIERIV